jgi:hypothetical protein
MNIPEWLSAEITRRAETNRAAENDRLARKAAYDRWAETYSAPTITIRSLEVTEVCQSCGRPYFIADGHNCTGPRSSASPENVMAAAVS